MIYLLDKTVECKEYRTWKKRKFEHEESQLLLSYAINNELGMQYDESMVQLEKCGKPNIRRSIPIEYNYSHCNGLLTCILSDKPVGIDVEKIRSFSLKTLEKVCDENEVDDIMKHNFPEKRFFEYWTLKESYVKAIGSSIFRDISNIHFNFMNNKIISNKADYYFHQFIWKNEYVIALCIQKN